MFIGIPSTLIVNSNANGEVEEGKEEGDNVPESSFTNGEEETTSAFGSENIMEAEIAEVLIDNPQNIVCDEEEAVTEFPIEPIVDDKPEVVEDMIEDDQIALSNNSITQASFDKSNYREVNSETTTESCVGRKDSFENIKESIVVKKEDLKNEMGITEDNVKIVEEDIITQTLEVSHIKVDNDLHSNSENEMNTKFEVISKEHDKPIDGISSSISYETENDCQIPNYPDVESKLEFTTQKSSLQRNNANQENQILFFGCFLVGMLMLYYLISNYVSTSVEEITNNGSVKKLPNHERIVPAKFNEVIQGFIELSKLSEVDLRK